MEIDGFVSSLSREEHVDDDGTFYFETSYAAFNSNPDYQKLMKSLCVLESQREKIIKDIQDLEELKLRALEDPHTVAKDIIENKLTCTGRIKVEKVPEIDFSKYSLCRDQASKSQKEEKEEPKKHSSGKQEIKVRGRVYNEKKPQTFNQLWTAEEQLRLEQLLIEFPPEPVEFRRWEKIADALGSRTAQQVCSRVQKYFKKLEKAGLKPSNYRPNARKKRAYQVHKRNKHYLYRPSTFFPGSEMGELGDTDSDEQEGSDPGTVNLSHWDDILKKIKDAKENEELRVEHIDYECKKCKSSPIVGIRWECRECKEVNFCSDCMSIMLDLSPPPHPLGHRFKPIEFFSNASYATDTFQCDNYLDPNSHSVI